MTSASVMCFSWYGVPVTLRQSFVRVIYVNIVVFSQMSLDRLAFKYYIVLFIYLRISLPFSSSFVVFLPFFHSRVLIRITWWLLLCLHFAHSKSKSQALRVAHHKLENIATKSLFKIGHKTNDDEYKYFNNVATCTWCVKNSAFFEYISSCFYYSECLFSSFTDLTNGTLIHVFDISEKRQATFKAFATTKIVSFWKCLGQNKKWSIPKWIVDFNDSWLYWIVVQQENAIKVPKFCNTQIQDGKKAWWKKEWKNIAMICTMSLISVFYVPLHTVK